MKHAMSAAVALALGIGLAAAGAQAQGTAQQSGASNMNMPPAASGHQMQTGQHMQTGQRITRQDIRQAQQQLKSDGLYKGRIDGMLGHRTRLAITRFQKQNGLPHTARLDRTTLDRLMGGQGAGVGSSMPTGTSSNATQNPNNSGNPAPMTPPATQTPSAGDNNLPSDHNGTH
jgi:peptidoglycan hydrolase-like protein with peptidoglycan-binding domain